jgi:hypothetical protein
VPVLLGYGDGAAEDALTQPHTFGVVVQSTVPYITNADL